MKSMVVSMTDQYDQDIDKLIAWNRDLRPRGLFAAFSGSSGFILGQIDPDLPYGVIRNGDGRLYDVLEPAERQENPLPEGYHAGEFRALVIKDA
jgi:hypothetical protein